jgi:chromosomal replication initiation ATPase DnaA
VFSRNSGTIAEDILREETKKPLTIDGIQKQVAEHFGVRLAEYDRQKSQRKYCIPSPGGHVSGSAPH